MSADARYAGPAYVRLSPTRINTALDCPRKFRYRYVDRLEPRGLPSMLAFGRAVHAAIAAAYANQNAPLDSAGVADAFTRHFAVRDEQGISYKEGEDYDKLDAKGRALVSCWYEQFIDDVLDAKVWSLESELVHDIEPGLAVVGHPDVIEERDGQLCVGEHKTVGSWGETNEMLVGRSVQLTAYAYLCWKHFGRLPDALYITVLKKTKKPEAFRCYTMRSAEEVAAFEDQAREIATLIRHYAAANTYPCNFHRDCGWCGFHPKCWGLEGADAMFVKRKEKDER